MSDTNTGYRNSGDWNTGNKNSGDRNTGDRNSGDWNSGYRNSGDLNTGNRNSGYRNSGDLNSGDRNTGDLNTGNRNSGYRNSGDRNSGNRNSGDWNSGYRNSGYLNTTEPPCRIFNKETRVKRADIIFPNFFFFKLNEWVNENQMTDKEKEENPTYGTMGGYLKTKEYKEAWRESWNNTTDEDRRKVLELPNWDNEVFKEITGIDVEEELGEEDSISKEEYEALKLLKDKGYRIIKD